jgi:tetratricopeptide (TPR) repeat protein
VDNPNNISQEEFERIESYLLKSMGEEEKVVFEKELLENKELSDKFQIIESILGGIEEAVFKENLEVFHQELQENTKNNVKEVKIFPWKPLSIAASFLLLMGLFTWLFLFRPDANEQLFMAHYQPDPGLVTAMGNSMEYEFDRGMVDFKLGDYAAAIQRWEKLIQEKPGNDTLNYFLGAAHLGLRNTDSSEFYFEKVLSVGSSRFIEDAFWYLALTNVLKGDFEKALSNLDQSNHPEKEKLIQSLQKK